MRRLARFSEAHLADPAPLGAARGNGADDEPVRRIPRWVRAVLLRGLATDPEVRWPSLAALLRVIERDRQLL